MHDDLDTGLIGGNQVNAEERLAVDTAALLERICNDPARYDHVPLIQHAED